MDDVVGSRPVARPLQASDLQTPPPKVVISLEDDDSQGVDRKARDSDRARRIAELRAQLEQLESLEGDLEKSVGSGPKEALIPKQFQLISAIYKFAFLIAVQVIDGYAGSCMHVHSIDVKVASYDSMHICAAKVSEVKCVLSHSTIPGSKLHKILCSLRSAEDAPKGDLVRSAGSSSQHNEPWVVSDSLPYGRDHDQTLAMDCGTALPAGVGVLLLKEEEIDAGNRKPHLPEDGLVSKEVKEVSSEKGTEEKVENQVPLAFLLTVMFVFDISTLKDLDWNDGQFSI